MVRLESVSSVDGATGMCATPAGIVTRSVAAGARSRDQFAALPHAESAAPVQTLDSPGSMFSHFQLSLLSEIELDANTCAPSEASQSFTSTNDSSCEAAASTARKKVSPSFVERMRMRFAASVPTALIALATVTVQPGSAQSVFTL